jgi:hypothetical protein
MESARQKVNNNQPKQGQWLWFSQEPYLDASKVVVVKLEIQYFLFTYYVNCLGFEVFSTIITGEPGEFCNCFYF